MGWLVLRCLTLVIAALSLGPSFAHLLEAAPRLTVWSPELWRDATVFNGQYRLFGILGGPLDGGAILLAGALAYGLRKQAGFRLALAGAILYLVSLGVWLTFAIGRINIGQAAFALIGGYATAILATRFGLSYWLCLPLSGILAALVGTVLGFGILRLRGVYFAMITLSLTEAVRLAFLNGGEFTGGATGIPIIP